MHPGATLVVGKRDRFGRSRGLLIAILNALQEREIGFRSLTEQINVPSLGAGSSSLSSGSGPRSNVISSASALRLVGRLLARGWPGERPWKLDEKERRLLPALYAAKRISVADILRILKISPSTL
jgi:DNA invertase Pin-like site-specific DNA recombinase